MQAAWLSLVISCSHGVCYHSRYIVLGVSHSALGDTVVHALMPARWRLLRLLTRTTQLKKCTRCAAPHLSAQLVVVPHDSMQHSLSASNQWEITSRIVGEGRPR